MAKRYSQPQVGAQIDWSNPSSKGLQMLLMQQGGRLVDVVNPSVTWTANGNATSKVTTNGIASKFDGADDYFSATGYPNIVGAKGTFFMWCPRIGALDSNGTVWFGTNTGAISAFQNVTNTAYCFGSGSFATSTVSSVASTTNTSLVFTANTTINTQRYYRNGVSEGTPNATAPTAFAAGSKTFNFGRYVGGTSWDADADVVIAGFTTEVWTADQAKAFHDNPWALFRAANSPIFVSVSGGGGSPYTLTANAGAVAITGNAAGLSVNRTLTADAGSLAIAGDDVTLAFNRALIADTANVAIAGNDASLVFTPVGGPTNTLTADAGAVSISASDAALIATRKLIADAYAAVIYGADATLIYTPAALPTIGRPASDTSNSGWTASTGTDLFAMVDEVTPDPLDYIVTTATGSVCELALETTAYPGTASQALKYRASSSTGNSLIVRLKNGATTIRSETQLLTSSDTEYTITLTSGEIAAITSGSLSVELVSA